MRNERKNTISALEAQDLDTDKKSNVTYVDFTGSIGKFSDRSSTQDERNDIDEISEEELMALAFSEEILDTAESNPENVFVEPISLVDNSIISDDIPLERLAKAKDALNVLGSAAQFSPSLFAHGGAFCAHCVGAVGNVGGSLGSVAGAGGGLGGLGGGHFHADGTYHAQAHGTSSSPSHDHSPSFSPSISQPSQSASRNTIDWQFWYNGSTVDVTKGLFQFGPENPIKVEECIRQLLLLDVA